MRQSNSKNQKSPYRNTELSSKKTFDNQIQASKKDQQEKIGDQNGKIRRHDITEIGFTPAGDQHISIDDQNYYENINKLREQNHLEPLSMEEHHQLNLSQKNLDPLYYDV